MNGYREDIEGFRGLAVLLAVGFHLGVFPGGFVGVDIFFVVSGFVISRLVLHELDQRTFSFASFYARRVRRLVPALSVTLAWAFVIGAFVLAPEDYAGQAESSIWAALGAANIYMQERDGYFAAPSELIPLLHAWSLGIEEQFYLVWPGLLWWARRRGWPLLNLVSALFVTSLVACLVAFTFDSRLAFFATPFRVWELALGAVALLCTKPARGGPVHTAAALVALAVWVGAALIPSSSESALFSHSLPATLATAFLLTQPSAIITKGLSNKLLRALGQISYSLYLCHWPLLVFFRHYRNGQTAIEHSAALLLFAGSVVIAWVTWRFVESPIRRAKLSNRMTAALFALCVAAVVAVSTAIILTDGARSRVPPAARELQPVVAWNWQCPNHVTFAGRERCTVGAPWAQAETKILLWGDSHGAHWLPELDLLGKQTNSSVVFVHNLGCAGVVSPGGLYRRRFVHTERQISECQINRDEIATLIREAPEIRLIIHANLWPNIVDEIADRSDQEYSIPKRVGLLTSELARLSSPLIGLKRRIVILGDLPAWPTNQAGCRMAAQTSLWREPCTPEPWLAVDESSLQWLVHKEFRHQIGIEPLLTYFPTLDYWCRGGTCPGVLNGQAIYRDADHLRRNLAPAELEAVIDRAQLRRLLTHPMIP